MSEQKVGVVVLGHGSRRAEANEEVAEIVAMLGARRPDLRLEAAYAEFAEPKLEEAATRLIAAGAGEVVVVPLFLTVGNHLKRDIPERIARLRAQYPEVILREAGHLGTDELLVRLVEKRISEALAHNSPQG